MTCNICNTLYFGETSKNMNSRCRGHESSIRTEKDHPIYNHTIDDYSITIMDKETNKIRRFKIGRIMDDLTKHTNSQRT